MSWAGKFFSRKRGRKLALTAFCRIQKECQSRDHPGHDEDWYETHQIEAGIAANDLQELGHVEKTNDRDYEVEERYGATSMPQYACTENILQAVPDNGSSISAVTERSKGIFGFIARWAIHRSDAGSR